MGLDMYLTKRIYIGAHYDHRKVQGSIHITVGGTPIPINLKDVDTINMRAGYWRKANQIHKWFVENVQDGDDNCGEYYVSEAHLKDLLNTINAVLASSTPDETAMELLPPTSGFFFGSTELDKWYWDDLRESKKIIDAALRDLEEESKIPSVYISFYYTSSW